MDMADLLETLYRAMKQLSVREEFVVRCRFGLISTREEFTLEKLGERLGVSRERVRQIERAALKKLKGAFA